MEGEGAGNDGEEFKFEGLGIEGDVDVDGDDVVGALKSLLKSKFCCCNLQYIGFLVSPDY